ncbi:BEL1-like homeodomain protein 1 [Primulina tabacum]|uniref:BEL1-like homeodomain protein 1 n=1 Tax=Primulina tabacum TaxID=48773 RepID=UPI003F5A150A
MATYFHGNSDIQGSSDGLQTLIFMNPAYVGFSDSQPQPATSSNFVFLNPNSSVNTLHLPHAPPSQSHHFVGIPFHGATTSAATTQDTDQHDVSGALQLQGFLPHVHYNPYTNPTMDLEEAREVTRAQQGLSLSLSSQQPPSEYGSFMLEREVTAQPLVTAVSQPRANDVKVSGGSTSPASGVCNSRNGVQSVILSSKYLKAAQELLDEVVKVGRGAKSTAELPAGEQPKKTGDSAADTAAGVGGEEGSEKRGAELSTAERQQIQMKKAKLVNMLDEVEQRYGQYHHQMQMVISWFEQAAGIGSARTYTALALQTISKQFRCLKDAIFAQIRASSKSLGEEDSFVGKIEGSRLKYVDNQIRQQRALQQLGMIQNNAWRPQRGLPERSVSVLRAWLFEHFLHPYPKDSDKLMLAKQTGLTRSQVSNWFINARVRLWKPMVEEMYMEEIKEQEKNGSDDKSGKTEQNEVSTSKSTAPQTKKPAILSQNQDLTSKIDNPINNTAAASIATSTALMSPPGFKSNHSFLLIGSSSETGTFTQGSPKKPRNTDMLHSLGTLMGAPTNFSAGFGSYQIGELGTFVDDHIQAQFSGNGVSLTLGLPHSHQNFMPNQSIQLGRGNELGKPNDFSSMNSTPNSYTLNHCV